MLTIQGSDPERHHRRDSLVHVDADGDDLSVTPNRSDGRRDSGAVPRPILPAQFGAVASVYDRGRPGYPIEVIEYVLEFCDPARPRILEVGAGTGKATAALASRGWSVVAIEPSGDMASLAEGRCRNLPQVVVVVSTFEKWNSQEDFGLVVSAQAWHWVEAPTRTINAHEVLSPSGHLALLWTHPVWDQVSLREPFEALYQTFAPELVASGPWFPGFGGPYGSEKPTKAELSGRFDPIITRSWRWSERYSPGKYLDLLRSLPEHDRLAEREREDLFAGHGHEIELNGGFVDIEYETRTYVAKRR